MIPGRFFRGVLEPSDVRFASIADATDGEVREYLRAREVQGVAQPVARVQRGRRGRPVARGAGDEARVPGDGGTGLLARHESAERVGWESQVQQTQVQQTQHEQHSPIPMPTQPTQPTQYTQFSQHSPAQSPTHTQDMAMVTASPVRGWNVTGARARRFFTEQETQNLIEGIRRFGNDWRRIQAHYSFQERTNVDLKDKARNLVAKGLL